MSDVQDPTMATVSGGRDGRADDDPHGGRHGEGHDTVVLGPIDVAAWTAGLLGVLIGLVMALGFVIATNRLVL